MTINERVIIVENGEYLVGYRNKYKDSSSKFEKKDKCFGNILEYNKIKNQSKKIHPKLINKTFKSFYSGIYWKEMFNILSDSVNMFNQVEVKMDLLDTYTSFLDRVYGKKYFDSNLDALNKKKDFLLNSIFECPDLTLSIFIKTVTKEYYSLLLKKTDTSTIRMMERLIVSNDGSDEILNKVFESVEPNKSKDKYYDMYKKKLINNLLINRFASTYNHLCSMNCKLKYFDNCNKIHNYFWSHDITEYPFIKDGYQVEVEDKDGTWKLEELIVEKCDFKNSNHMTPSKKLTLLNEKK